MQYLLPYKDPKSNTNPYFIIESEGSSCVRFETTSPYLLRVSQLNKKATCQKEAKVEVVASGSGRQTATIIASSGTESQQLMIYINAISTLEFKSSTKSIFIESEPRTFELVGYDEKGNMFDSLEGLKFNFAIDKEHLKIEQPKNLNLVPLDSSITTMGTKVGDTWIKASYGSVATKIDLCVIEPIGLFPGPTLNVFPNTTIPFKLCSTRGSAQSGTGRRCTHEITGEQLKKYTIKISDTTVVSIGSNFTGLAKKLGIATFTITDKNATDNIAEVIIKVQYPKSTYQEEQFIPLGANPKFQPIFHATETKLMDLFPSIPFYVKSGNWNTLGKKEITLAYMDYEWKAIVNVCNPIRCIPSRPVIPIGGILPLNITGGSGFYNYTLSSNNIISNVNSTITGLVEGIVNFTVIDKNIKNFNLTVSVLVSHVYNATIEIPYAEVLVGNETYVDCAFFAKGNLQFSIPISYKVYSSHNDIAQPKRNGKPNEIEGKSVGFSQLLCRADNFDSPAKNISIIQNLQAEVRGNAAPFSTIPIFKTYGPAQWPGSPQPALQINCSGGVKATPKVNFTFQVDRPFKGKCTATIQNAVTKENRHPIKMSATFLLYVANISQTKLVLVQPQPFKDPVCRTPLQFPMVSDRLEYDIAPNTPFSIHSFAVDKYDNVLHYHDIAPERIAINGKLVERQFRSLSRGDAYSNYSALTDFVFSANGKYPSAQYKARVMSPLSVEPSKTIYLNSITKRLNMSGGSGIYGVKKGPAHIDNGSIVLDIKNIGRHELTVYDKCLTTADITKTITAVKLDDLVINAPAAVPINRPFKVYVQPTMGGAPIDREFYREINATLESVASIKKIAPLAYEIVPKKVGPLVLTTISESIVRTKTIRVLNEISFEPSTVIVMPDETVDLNKVSGPDSLVFSFDRDAMSISRLSITAIKPGNYSVEVTSVEAPSLPPFVLTVVIPEPQSISISTTAPNGLIKDGLVELFASVMTNCGAYKLRSAEWSVSEGFDVRKRGESSLLINLTNSGLLTVCVDSYGLRGVLEERVQPKLAFESAEYIVAPNSRLQLRTIERVDNTTITVLPNHVDSVLHDNALVTSSKTGLVYVMATAGGQRALAVVRVEVPHSVISVEERPGEMRLVLTDCYSRVFSSFENIRFNATTNSSLIRLSVSSNIITYSPAVVYSDVFLTLTASNSAFRAESSTVIPAMSTVYPERPFVAVGSQIQMRTTFPDPKWSLADGAVAGITPDGLLTAKMPGTTRVLAGRHASTLVTVVKLEGFDLRQSAESRHTIEVRPIFDIDGVAAASVKEMAVGVTASLSHGAAHVVRNASGIFIEYRLRGSADRGVLNVEMTSPGLRFKKSLEVERPPSVDFGISPRHRVSLTKPGVAVVLNVSIPSDDLVVRKAPKGTRVAVVPGGVSVAADGPFKPGAFTIEHRQTREHIAVEVEWGAASGLVGAAKAGRSWRFYWALISLAASGAIILQQLGLQKLLK